MAASNPFLKSKPVPPERFVGRQDAVRTVLSRLNNGESTAIVGEPKIGKSSLHRYLTDGGALQRGLPADAGDRLAVIVIDCHIIPQEFTPAAFWRQILAEPLRAVPDPALADLWKAADEGNFNGFALRNLFTRLGRLERRVVLLLDEFDTLIHHARFGAEFFGPLRSIATTTDGLAVITASRARVTEMNRLLHDYQSAGSPYLNFVTEVPLGALTRQECRTLLDSATRSSGVAFDDGDLAHLIALSGRHPFLFQTAAAVLFDRKAAGDDPVAQFENANTDFAEQTAAHFDDYWRHLSTNAQTVLVILTLAELHGRFHGRSFDVRDAKAIHTFHFDLEGLERLGMVEQVTTVSLGRTSEGSVPQWRIASRGIVGWLAEHIIAGSGKEVKFDDWLSDKERTGLLTREQTETLRGWAGAIPKDAIVSGAKKLLPYLIT